LQKLPTITQLQTLKWVNGRICDAYGEVSEKEARLELRGGYEIIGAKPLAEAVTLMTSLTYLDLGKNFLEMTECLNFVKAVKGKPMKFIGLSNSVIGHYGGMAIANYIQETPSLKRMDLMYTRLDTIARSSLIDAMKDRAGGVGGIVVDGL